MIKTCKNCGQQFDGRINKEFCSKKCNNEYAYRLTKNVTAENSADDYDVTADDYDVTAENSAENYNVTAEKMQYNRLNSAEYSDSQPFRQFTNPNNTIKKMNENTVSVKEYDRVCDDLDNANETINELRQTVEQLKENLREVKTQSVLSKRSQDDFSKLEKENSGLGERLYYVNETATWLKTNADTNDLLDVICDKANLQPEQKRVVQKILKIFNGGIRQAVKAFDTISNEKVSDYYNAINLTAIDYSDVVAVQKENITAAPKTEVKEVLQPEVSQSKFSIGIGRW